jgi:tetratricopeptide (TPR) repeat protein
VPVYRQELAHTHNNIGMLLQRREPREAEKAYRRVLELQDRLVGELPKVPALLNELGRTSSNLAELLLQQGRPAEAREHAERAVRRQRAALKLLPGHPAYASALAQHYRVLAEALVRLGDHAAASQAVAEMPRTSGSDERVDRFAPGSWPGVSRWPNRTRRCPRSNARCWPRPMGIRPWPGSGKLSAMGPAPAWTD